MKKQDWVARSGEDTEGGLVSVAGRVSQPLVDDQPFGFGVFLDDGSGEVQAFIHVSSGLNPFEMPFVEEGACIRVTGFSGHFEEFIEVSPRRQSDVLPGRAFDCGSSSD